MVAISVESPLMLFRHLSTYNFSPLSVKQQPPCQTDYKASGVQLPPNWVGGYRTRSTNMSPYKVCSSYVGWFALSVLWMLHVQCDKKKKRFAFMQFCLNYVYTVRPHSQDSSGSSPLLFSHTLSRCSACTAPLVVRRSSRTGPSASSST